jgi:hypothetical protein
MPPAGALILPRKLRFQVDLPRSNQCAVDPVSEIETFLGEYWEIFYSPAPAFRREVVSWMFVSHLVSLTHRPNLMEYTGD